MSPLSYDSGPTSSIEELLRKVAADSSERTEQLIDIFTTRGILEERAARLAARNLTAKDAEDLAELVRAMESASRSQRAEELVRLDRRLHFTIYRAARRPHMERIIEQLWADSDAYVSPVDQLPDLSPEGKHVLRSIVSACELKDENALGILVRYKIHRRAAHVLETKSQDS